MYCLNELKPTLHRQYKTIAALDFLFEDERQRISKQNCSSNSACIRRLQFCPLHCMNYTFLMVTSIKYMSLPLVGT